MLDTFFVVGSGVDIRSLIQAVPSCYKINFLQQFSCAIVMDIIIGNIVVAIKVAFRDDRSCVEYVNVGSIIVYYMRISTERAIRSRSQ